MTSLRRILKAVKYRIYAALYVLRRTVLAPLYGIKLPLNKKICFGTHVKLGSGTRVYFYSGSLQVEKDTVICNYSKIIVGGGKLKIGENCLLGEYGIYNTFADLIIGNDVITADRISFVTNIHQYENIDQPIKNQPSVSGPIEIGDGTWIGMNATILANTHIGKNCVVAAHSVVKGDFPDYCVIGGTPAQILKRYNENTGKWDKVPRTI